MRQTGWQNPRLTRTPEPERRQRQIKVIRIYWTWAEGTREGIKWVQENEPNPDVEFAVEEKPKGWLQHIFKQIVG